MAKIDIDFFTKKVYYKSMKRIAGILLLNLSLLFAERSFDINFYLNYETIYHKVDDNFKVVDSGINKNYIYSPGEKNEFSSSSGYNIKTNLSFSPFDRFFVSSKISFVPEYADRFWLPVNDSHRLEFEGKDYRVEATEIKYITNVLNLRYFKGVPHASWRYKGDLFNFFPEQYETERYLRVSGRTPPEGYEISYRTRYSDFQLVYGPEVIWGYRDGIYCRYNLDFGTLNLNLFARSDVPDYVKFWDSDERMNSYQMSFSYSFSSQLKGYLGIMYRPFRLNERYQYYESGVLEEDEITTKDAFGVKAGFIYNPYFIVNEIKLNYSYLGLVAGNKEAIEISGYRPISKSLTLSGMAIFQKPLIGPLPLIYEGTEDSPGPIYSNPRGADSPFWVSWYYDDWNNREANIFKLNLLYDPTPSTWFFRYEPNVLEEWNLNPDEDAKLSFALEYKLFKYMSGMDRFYYWDENGDIVWEPYGLTGPWEQKNFFHQFKIITRLRLHRCRILSFISLGDSLALGSYAYDNYSQEKNGLVPLINYYDFILKIIRGRIGFNMRYAIDPWGPEEWHMVFGEKIDKIYSFGLNYRLKPDLNFGIKYIRVKEEDFVVPPEIGSYKEFRFYLNYRFGLNLKFEE
ncbi:MAG: hypothetical protein DRI36_00035 [Caldiserica bacterium]|nr:MAG: hypothetical protein DRI36_00035 [Caldisericota bacterium]